MKSKRLMAIGSLALLSLSIQNIKSTEMQMRDLSHYDKAGPYTIKLGLEQESPDTILAKIREFLWNHWQQRRLGRLVATFYSKEGEPSKNTFVVEPNPSGRWQITVETERVLSGRQTGVRRKLRETTKGVYPQVERIEPPKDGLIPAIIVAEKEVRDPTDYRLRLRNRRPTIEIVL